MEGKRGENLTWIKPRPSMIALVCVLDSCHAQANQYQKSHPGHVPARILRVDGAPVLACKVRPEDPKDLERIQATAIDEVWIDTSRGWMWRQVIRASREEADLQIDSEFAQLEDMPAIVIEEPPALRCLSGAANPRRCKMKSNWRPPFAANPNAPSFRCSTEARMGKVVDAANAAKPGGRDFRTPSDATPAHSSPGRLKTADDYTYMHSGGPCAMMVAWPGLVRRRTPAVAGWPCCTTWARPPSRCPVLEQTWQAHRQRVCGGQEPPGRGLQPAQGRRQC